MDAGGGVTVNHLSHGQVQDIRSVALASPPKRSLVQADLQGDTVDTTVGDSTGAVTCGATDDSKSIEFQRRKKTRGLQDVSWKGLSE